jgi:hypothetical protein
MKTAHSAGSTTRSLDDDLANGTAGGGDGELGGRPSSPGHSGGLHGGVDAALSSLSSSSAAAAAAAAAGTPSSSSAAAASSHSAAQRESLRIVQRDHPAFKRRAFAAKWLLPSHQEPGVVLVADGIWCALCLQFMPPQDVCVCVTCKAMVCCQPQCAVATVGVASSQRKFECRTCWCDHWYAGMKDNEGEVVLGSRIFPGE